MSWLSTANVYSKENDDEVTQNLAEIYSLIVTIDQLEKAYIRDSFSYDEYSGICSKLLAQYNTILNNRDVEAAFQGIDEFRKKYGMKESTGIQRILTGIPARSNSLNTRQAQQSEFRQADPDIPRDQNDKKSTITPRKAAVILESFINLMDALKLHFWAKDQLHPMFSALMTHLNDVDEQTCLDRGKLVKWLTLLNRMKIDECLTETQYRECFYDLEIAYNKFFESLPT